MIESLSKHYTVVHASLETEEDLASSRLWMRLIAQELGLNTTAQTKASTAVSEIARNALIYGGGGSITFQLDLKSEPQELHVLVEDEGPGIGDTDRVLEGGYSSGKGLGLGIAGSRRLVDRLEVKNKEAGGVRVAISIELSNTDLTLSEACRIRDKIIDSGELDPIAELRRQNQELLASLQLIEQQKDALASANARLAKSEKAERELSNQLHAILDNLPDAIVLYGADGKFAYSNSAAKTLTGDSGGNGVPFDLTPRLDEAVRSGKEYCPTGKDGVIQKKVNGADRYFLPRVFSLLDPNEKIRGALMLLRDVSDLQLVDDLKGDLLGTVSHEIKGPVTSIRMAVLLLLDNDLGPLNSVQRELADSAKEEVERLLRMLNNLLDVRRYSEGRYELSKVETDVSWILDRCLSEMKRDAGRKSIALEIDYDTDKKLTLCVDRERFIYALNNLVSNAIKHSPENSVVKIVAVEKEEGRISISVIDQGPGISKSHHQLIFNAYAKAPGNSKPGSGLGLAITREFVQAHDGEVGVESELGAGSRFFIELPLAKADYQLG